ncbi:MAG: helix-turn-helix transcriptional regulator [Ilumatobacteraceae bacterium]
MRAGRLVQLVLLLQRSGHVTAAWLAHELEVSVRTVYRDIEALSGIGIPVLTSSGPGGGVSLLDGYQTRLTGLTGAEAGALGLAGVPEVAAQLGMRSLLMAAQAKVDAALPPELRQRSMRLRERFLVDAPGWFEQADPPTFLEPISAAVWDGRQLEIRYERSGTVVRRRVDPLGLVLKGARWYVVAVGRRPAGLRLYRVDRVRGVRTLADAVVRPDGFDLAIAWGELGRDFDRHLRRVAVRIAMPADELWRLRHALTGPAAEEAASTASDHPDGRRVMTVHSESVEVAHDELVRLGRHVEVLEPPELRAMLAETATVMAERHRGQVTAAVRRAPTAAS